MMAAVDAIEKYQLHAQVAWAQDSKFIGTTPSGHIVQMDRQKQDGGTPMELVLLGLGGCASVDVVGILQKKRMRVNSVVCHVYANRVDGVPAVFSDILLRFAVDTDAEDKDIVRAIELSAQKYCSVSKMLVGGGVVVRHDFVRI